MTPLILDFKDATPDELGEILWVSFMAARLVCETGLRVVEPRPEWDNQNDETKALWNYFAERLLALHGQRV